MQYFVGIDVGTSSTKVVLCDVVGDILATSTQSYLCAHPHPGWSEQDPECWYEAAIHGIKSVVSDADISSEDITGLSFGGQMHGLVALDSDGRVLRPAILWNDGRSIGECDYLNRQIGKQKLSEWCGNIAFPGFTGPKVLWMKANEPDLFAQIDMVLLPKDYVAYRLTGSYCTDVSDASGTLFFDVRKRCWSKPMLDIVGLNESQLPRVYESWEVVGTLTQEASCASGLPQTVKVCAGAGDNAAAAVGMGAVGEGRCNVSLGTSGTVFMPTNDMHVDSSNSLHSFADASGSYHLMGCILSAASANGWWVKQILGSDFAAELTRIDPANLGSNSVFFLPYLMGERSPVNDADARAAFVGMTLETSKTEMVQAVLEGVTFALRQCLEAALAMGVNIDELTICGGGAKNRIWRQMVADVLDMPLSIQEKEEGPGYGACILAMVGCDMFESVEAAVDVLKTDASEVVEPDKARARRYESRYKAYCSLYPALKQVFPYVLEAEG